MAKQRITPISETDRNAVKRLTAAVLPDSPAAHGMKAAQVKPKFWRALIEGEDSIVGLLNRIIREMNKSIAESDDEYAGCVTGITYDRDRQSFTVTFGDGTKQSLDRDLRGNGIQDIQKTGTEGLVDTYTVYMTNGTTETFTVTNGEKGKQGDPGEVTVEQLEERIAELLVEAKGYTESKASDALTEAKAYTDNELATFDFIKVVDSLPATGLPNKVYLVPKADTQTQDLFDEYIWVDGKWEWVTTKQLEVDLTPYMKTSELLDKVYPVGSIYMSTKSVSPGTFLGGTWARIEVRFLLGASTTYVNGITGGSATVKLEKQHMPSHTHNAILSKDNGTLYTRDGIVQAQVTGGWHRGVTSNPNNSDGTVITDSAGGGQAHNNMPPYLAVYMWKRTA